jgi:hypothetical protein
MTTHADDGQIFRAVHHLLLTATHNPFSSLPPSFRAKRAPIRNGPDDVDGTVASKDEHISNPPISLSKMFAASPDDIDGEMLKRSRRFQEGMTTIGDLLSGGR